MTADVIYEATEAVTNIPIPGVNQFIESLRNVPKLDQYAGELTYAQVLLSLTIAAALGALIANHPKRNVEADGPVYDKELKNTKILICVAGAVMVALIQGSLERAFGLVGLGSFVRYRTALRNPVDLSIIFLLIGLGMACGLQYYEFAIAVAGFIYVLIYLLEFSGMAERNIWTLKVDTTDPARVEKVFCDLAQEKNLRILRMKSSKQRGGYRCRFRCKQQLDTDLLTKEIQRRCGEGIRYTRFEWEFEQR
ncbi:MAG: DUF4956 domain-containing protein [Candidatus Omnitrophota bacterium]|jgi:uncharacterized membrane protein YhiD involved in acid resistance|nr:MAG: DUF4956 domain-containing protein [Candidatus Omnitrophota bacterium]